MVYLASTKYTTTTVIPQTINKIRAKQHILFLEDFWYSLALRNSTTPSSTLATESSMLLSM